MITQEQQKEGSELVKVLAQKAWESSTFKEQLVKNPISAIESVTGKKFAENVKIVVEDQTDNSIIYLNIPRKVELNDLELTDEQLEMVAGGEMLLFIAGMTIGVAIWAATHQH